jgi:hypothetical protein
MTMAMAATKDMEMGHVSGVKDKQDGNSQEKTRTRVSPSN